jgi:hypothetical protein
MSADRLVGLLAQMAAHAIDLYSRVKLGATVVVL